MNIIFSFFHRHTHLLVVSLMSALLVLTFQVIMSSLTRDPDELPPNLRVENIDIEVISLKEASASVFKPISVLSKDELKIYDTQGWVARKNLHAGEAQGSIFIERLQLTLSDSDIKSGKQEELKTHIKSPSNFLSKVRICGEDGLDNSCTRYAYNQAGDSIPLLFTYSDKVDTREGAIHVSILGDSLEKKGIFSLTEEFLFDIEPLF